MVWRSKKRGEGWFLREEDAGDGLPRALITAADMGHVRRCAGELEAEQEDLEQFVSRFRTRLDATKHPNGMKKRPGKLSMGELQALFAYLPCESVSLFLLPLIFHRPLAEESNPDRARDRIVDESLVDLAHFLLHAMDFGRKSDLEVLVFLLDAILPLPGGTASAETVVSQDGFRELLATMHGSASPELDFLVEQVPKGPLRLADVVSFAFALPPLFWPVHHFVRTFRRKIFGTRFWARTGRVRAVQDANDALERSQINPDLCEVYGALSSYHDAWRVAMHNLVVILNDDSIAATCAARARAAEELHSGVVPQGRRKKNWKTRLRTPGLQPVVDQLYPKCCTSGAIENASAILGQKFQGKIAQWVASFLVSDGLETPDAATVLPPAAGSHHMPRTRHGYRSMRQGSSHKPLWSQESDPKSGMAFWLNVQTGESRWTHPDRPWVLETASSREDMQATSTPVAEEESPEGSVGHEHEDPEDPGEEADGEKAGGGQTQTPHVLVLEPEQRQGGLEEAAEAEEKAGSTS